MKIKTTASEWVATYPAVKNDGPAILTGCSGRAGIRPRPQGFSPKRLVLRCEFYPPIPRPPLTLTVNADNLSRLAQETIPHKKISSPMQERSYNQRTTRSAEFS